MVAKLGPSFDRGVVLRSAELVPSSDPESARILATHSPPSVPRSNCALIASAATQWTRVNGRAAQVRRSFVVAEKGKDSPAALMLRGGRGGEVRLKLYLSLLWFAASPPHDATYPARAWAALLGLEDPDGNGARRINDAFAWLDERHFIRLERLPGRPSTAFLRYETGTGQSYDVPGAVMRAIPDELREHRAQHRYFQIPPSFWINGWVVSLSGAATVMFLALLAESREDQESKGIWFSQSVAAERFSLSPQTRSKGLRELAHQRLVSVRQESLADRDPFAPSMTRNVYTLNRQALADLTPRAKPLKRAAGDPWPVAARD